MPFAPIFKTPAILIAGNALSLDSEESLLYQQYALSDTSTQPFQ
ncbi:MAG: hypothetical protein KatS3mg031_0867 [Chitinophagales bacterium]|nr:MAG: hypothetical protein KatS3mg031_0867 [Chitinophagales bacterium]